jgi:hypothetical protein
MGRCFLARPIMESEAPPSVVGGCEVRDFLVWEYRGASICKVSVTIRTFLRSGSLLAYSVENQGARKNFDPFLISDFLAGFSHFPWTGFCNKEALHG